MVKFTYSNSQRLHNSLISRLIQSLINPLVLFGVFMVSILITYRMLFLKLNNQFSVENSLSGSSNLSIMSMNLSTHNNKFDIGTIIDNEKEQYLNYMRILLEDNINTTSNFLSQHHEEIVKAFNSTLASKLNSTEMLITEQTTINSLLKSLNSTIIDSLAQDKSSIEDVKAQLENAVFVGDTVNTSNLTLNYEDIQQSLQDAINSQDSTYDNSTLLELEESRTDFLAEIDDVFQQAISNIEDLKTSIDFNSTSYQIQFNPNLANTEISNTNDTINNSISTSQMTNFKTQSNNNLITIGVFLLVAYLLIMVYQYFKFRYQLNYTAASLVDLEKSESKMDYIGVIQATNEPTVTMITDVQSQLFGIDGQNERIFWINSYLFGESSNLPYLFMMGFIFLILMLSLSKLKWESVGEVESSNASYTVLKQYNLTQFETIDENNELNNQVSKFVDNYNSKIQDNFQNISTTLQDIYDSYNITTILSLEPMDLQYQNITISTFNSSILKSSLVQDLQNLQFEMDTKINISSIQFSTFLNTTFNLISNTFIHITRLFLISTAITFLIIITIGIIYSFLI